MRRTRVLPSAAFASAAAASIALVGACNAIVGNGDIQFATDAGSGDATTTPDGPTDASAADVGPREAAGDDAATTSDAPTDASALPDAGCEAGTRQCGATCVGVDDSAYGCGSKRCEPCELANAYSGCSVPDGGANAGADGGGGALACSVAACKGTHADCNGSPLDGCEVDTSDDLYNCGACGHDCTTLPHVAGNVSCAAGVCSFTSDACAPGYGICTSDPNNGCDTVISEPGHCGGCTTSCTAGFPYCSPTGNGADPFNCTSGCAMGLNLCSASCVNEQNDPNHCGGCATQCPAVVGGTPICSAGGQCGFTCNANDHLCGAGNGASCAANNDPNNCGAGAACGKCHAPANATASCTGGTTCGYACNPGSHPCGGSCPLNDDPNNCGALCGTNCPGPTQGSGAATCDGNACSIACAAGQSLCGTACVSLLTDGANCGMCGNACAAGQTCSGAQCVCNASSCPNGCCDASGTCQPAACGTGGNACVAGCPATVPEARSLVLWLVGDSYASGASTWSDLSGRHADATCTQCPTSVAASGANGHAVVSFNGTSHFTLGDPGAQYDTTSWTIFVVAAPSPGSTANAQLLAFTSGGNAVGLQRSGSDDDLMFELLPGSATNSLVATGAWAGSLELVTAGVDATQNAFLTVSGSTVVGSIGAPAAVDYQTSYLGIDPSFTLPYTGQVAEVLVFNTTNMPSATSLQAYLAARYALQ